MDREVLQNARLRVVIDPDRMLASVELVGAGLRWRFDANREGDVRISHGAAAARAFLHEAPRKTVRRVRTPREERVTFFLQGLPGNTGAAITYALEPEMAMLRVEIEALPTGSSSRFTDAAFPGPLVWLDSTPQHTVWPNAAGMLLPNDYPAAIAPDGQGLEHRLAFNRDLYQPWWGVVGDRGGYLAIAETPFDFALDLRHPEGGPTMTRPAWLPSLGHLAYPRAIRYIFFDEATHVRLAKAYRDYSQQIGRLVSLEEKFARNPQARRLLGATIFPVSICTHAIGETSIRHDVVTFAQREEEVRRLRQMGREKAYLHIDGWGRRGYDNLHPDIFPPCPEAGGWEGLIALSRAAGECGYLFGLHDQYRDYYLDGPRFTESRAVKGAAGAIPQWSYWHGGPQSVLCAKEAIANIRENFTELLGRGVLLTASYLDVFAIVPMDECFDPAHPMTRQDCYRGRAAGLDYVRSLGLVISSEEPVDCFIPHLDFAHWADFPRTGFMRGEYLGIPVPLHSLVYHDALLLPGVFDYGGTPENRWRHFLEALGRVEIPYGNIAWDQPEDFRHVDVLANLHAAWGTAELVNHRLLDDAGLIQTFEYPEGSVTIDLAGLRYRITGGPLETKGEWEQMGD
jgi:hypothetical protein